MKTLELPYDEEIRLAVTGWSGTRRELPSWDGEEDVGLMCKFCGIQKISKAL